MTQGGCCRIEDSMIQQVHSLIGCYDLIAFEKALPCNLWQLSDRGPAGAVDVHRAENCLVVW